MADLIDRQPTNNNDSNVLDALDCVSRQAAIAIIKDCMLNPDDCRYENTEEINGVLRFAKDRINDMKHIERTGRWIWDDESYHCSECFYHAYGNTSEVMLGDFKFCPNCGARMEVEE